MKRIIFFLLLCITSNLMFAQDINDIGKIPLGVYMPDNIEGVNASNLSKLQLKVEQIVTSSGLTSAGYTPSFAIFPKLSVTDKKVVEGGMQNLIVVTIEMTLFIKQIENGILVSSVSKSLKGNGTSLDEAIGNAISKIASNDNDYKNFIKSGKEKIVSYYNDKCSDLMTLADNMVIKQDYEQALSILTSIPIEAQSCYKTAQLKSNFVYKSYQNKVCQSLILNAKAKIAATQYDEALNLLSQIDPLSQCSGEAKELIKATAAKVGEQQKKEWDMALKIYNDNLALEKYRINAIKEIAVAYLKKNSGGSRRHTE